MVPKLSIVLKPLYFLLRKDTVFTWDKLANDSFDKCKDLIAKSTLLSPFSVKDRLVNYIDAAKVGIAAILGKTENNIFKPIFFASRCTTDAESRYSQFDLEALSLVYAFTKFHKFVYGTDIIVFTDCKALLGVFASDTKRKLDDKLFPRVTRYVVFMSRYSYQLHHVSSSHNIVDFLSRSSYKNLNYCSDEPGKVPEYSEVIMSISDNTTLEIERVKIEILKDDTLRIVKNYVTNGWPDKVNQVESNARPYFRHRQQLSLDREFLWMGTRLVIPVVLQNAVIGLLHETHSGIVAMKRLARRHFYFPNINGKLENCVAECISCQEKANMNPKSDLCNWLGPKSPFVRVHVDHFFFAGKAIFLVVDAYSKWVELFIHGTPTTDRCISSLELVFTTHGYPETLVSDNHPCFKSFDMDVYCKSRNIKQLFSAPFSPYSNGLAESHVQATKRSLVSEWIREICKTHYIGI